MIERMQATVMMVNGQHPGTVRQGGVGVGVPAGVKMWEVRHSLGGPSLPMQGRGTGGNRGSAIHQPTQK